MALWLHNMCSVGQTNPAKQQKTSTTDGTFKGKVKLKANSRQEYDIIDQQLYEFQKKPDSLGVRKPQKAAEL